MPAEFTYEQKITLIYTFVQKIFASKGMCTDAASHDKREGNPPVHIMLTMRAISFNFCCGLKYETYPEGRVCFPLCKRL